MNKCRIVGHKNPSELETLCTGERVLCKRCGMDKETLEWDVDCIDWHAFGIFTLPARALWKLNALPSRIKFRLLDWWNPCCCCGLRFGRHDHNIQHIPF